MRRRVTALVAGTVIAAFAILGAAVPAQADDYPTWADVIAARKSVAAKQAEIKKIQATIKQLGDDVAATSADLDAKKATWAAINQRLQAKQAETTTLQAQADAAAKTATDAETRAGQWAAQLVRIGGTDPTLSLFAASDHASDVLAAIGVSTRISTQANSLYVQAVQDRNTAQALTDQANVAQADLKILDTQATAALADAQAASVAATKALTAQQDNVATLNAQLDTLQHNKKVTETDYKQGALERLKKSLSGLDWAHVTASGWVRPAPGFISSPYGWRPYVHGTTEFHLGVDLASGCGNPIIAAASGTVTFAAYWGLYGYVMIVDHGGGLTTRYAHQPAGGFKVKVGQHVEVGQRIGTVGESGDATGCHVHFEVRVNGATTDPVKFLAAEGVYI